MKEVNKMAIIKEKTDFVLKVKSKYTYRMFTNGSGGMSVEVQLTKDFMATSLQNFALAFMSKDEFEKRMTVEKINDLFLMLRKNISESGEYFELSPNYYGFIKS